MARTTPEKEPGRLKNMWLIFKMTHRLDRLALPLIITAFLLPIAIAVLIAVLVWPGDVLFTVMMSITGVLVGLMLAMLTLTWRAERAAYGQMEGQPGAVGSVLRNGLRGSWRTSEMPVQMNPKTYEAVYRAIGRPGVVLIAEGAAAKTNKLVVDEQRRLKRILPNVAIHVVQVGPDADSVPLAKLTRTVRRFKNTLTRPEVLAVSNRVTSLGSMPVSMPKGIDPRRVRPGRPR